MTPESLTVIVLFTKLRTNLIYLSNKQTNKINKMKKDLFLTDSIVAYLDGLVRNNPEWGFPEVSRQFDLMCEKANLSPTMVNLGYYYMGILTCEKMAKEKIMSFRKAHLN